MSDRRQALNRAVKVALAVPGDDAKDACFPHPSEVPDWSPGTLALLEGLTVLERAWVEWFVADGNAAEAYRRATGAEYTDRETDTTRKSGHQIAARPRVKAAVDAAMKDRNFNARSDLEWKLAKVRKAIARCEKMESLQAQQTLVDLVMKMATLQGEVRPAGETDGGDQRGGIRVRILEILADADRLVGGRKGPDGGPPGSPDSGPARPAVGAD